MTEISMQKVLITAGGSGIGKAMAEAFALTGAKIWIVDADQDHLDECPSDWRKEKVDVANPDEMSDLFNRIQSEWGGLDTLCANAGIAGPTALVEDQPIDDFKKCIAVNLEGAFLAVKGAIPMMKKTRSGSIIFTSSTGGLYGFPYRSPYASAKWAVHGLMKTVAMEAGPFGIRANVIAPGCVEGPRIDGVIEREALAKGAQESDIRDGYASGTSMRTFVRALDIANMAVFLASPGAERVSGQLIAVDGHTENPDPVRG